MAQDRLPPNLARRGYDAEVTRHRLELLRAIGHVEERLRAVRSYLDEGKVPSGADLRSIVADASEAYTRGVALAALEQVEFLVPDKVEG